MKVKYISNSQIDKYETCPYLWHLNYVERIRSVYKPSSLFFGSALDEAFGRLHLDKMAPERLTEAYKKMMEYTPEELFEKTLRYQPHNGETIDLKYSKITSFFKSDFELSLLTDEDLQEVSNYALENNLEISIDRVFDFMDECFEIVKSGQLTGGDLAVFNLVGWLSLYRKGLILLDAYRVEIMPQIKEVFEIQKHILLPDGTGVIYQGFIDYTASWNFDPENIRVCDDKTSSKAYPLDSVEKSTQLASYCEHEATNLGTYTVVEKGLRKRDPKYRVQVIHGEIPEETFELTFQRINSMIDNVEADNFPKACHREGGVKANCFHFGRKCEAYNLCHGDGTMTGLVEVPEREKENESNN